MGGPVRQVEWCGNDAIFVTWETAALLVGPFGDTLRYGCVAVQLEVTYSRPCRYYYTGATIAITEQDGVRIIGPDSCDFIEKVPGAYLILPRSLCLRSLLP